MSINAGVYNMKKNTTAKSKAQNRRSNIDTIINLSVFAFCFICGAIVFFILSEITVDIAMPWYVFSMICGVLPVMILRIILPYSRMKRSELKNIDDVCRQINQDAFSQSRTGLRKLARIVRLYHNNQFARALKRLDKLYATAQNNKDDAFAIAFWTGMCCFQLKFNDDAADEFEKCIEFKGYDCPSTVYSNLGLVYIRSEKHDKALDIFKRGYEHYKEDPYILYGMALCCLKLGMNVQALEYAENAMSFNGFPPETYAIAALAIAADKTDLSQKEKARIDGYCSKLEKILPEYAKKVRHTIFNK